MRLLLVEDDVMIGEALQKSLKKSNYSVDWLTNGLDVESSVNYVEYYNGYIFIEEGIEGKGTKFVISLPVSPHFR